MTQRLRVTGRRTIFPKAIFILMMLNVLAENHGCCRVLAFTLSRRNLAFFSSSKKVSSFFISPKVTNGMHTPPFPCFLPSSLAGIDSRRSHSCGSTRMYTSASSSPTPSQPSSSTVSLSSSHPPNCDTDVDDWRNHPNLIKSVTFKSLRIATGKSSSSIQSILDSKALQPYLATRHELVKGLQLRLKIVRDPISAPVDGAAETKEKRILMLPNAPEIDMLPDEARKLLNDAEVTQGEDFPLTFKYSDFTASYILHQILPEKVHPPTSAFETIGHVAHLNLPPRHLPYKYTIGQVLLATLPMIETVIAKVGEVSGPFRTYEHELLAGREDVHSTRVHVVESGIDLRFDVKDVYWCSRLSEERRRLLDQFRPYDIVADPFCGVGALCIQAASKKNCTIWANDWNPKAVEYLRENAKQNRVNVDRLQCGDAYDFLMDLGLQDGNDGGEKDLSEQQLPDHVVMNFPVKAPQFLGALRWWPIPDKKGDPDATIPRVHVHTFARSDPETQRSVEQVAIDLVASQLWDRGEVQNSQVELDRVYGCRVHAHCVRDVAPGKVVVCVSFSATPQLLRYMQGEF